MCSCIYVYTSHLHTHLQAQAFKEDFEQERKDRETAHRQLATAEQTFRDRIEQLEAQLIRLQEELQSRQQQVRYCVHRKQLMSITPLVNAESQLLQAYIASLASHCMAQPCKDSVNCQGIPLMFGRVTIAVGVNGESINTGLTIT